MPFDVHSSRSNRRSDDDQTIFRTVLEAGKTGLTWENLWS
jgi:hypothetical protein